jgi:hypothetical protein
MPDPIDKMLPSGKDSAMPELDQQITAYQAAEGDLAKLHLGKAVVFAEGKLQGIYDDAGIATHEAIKHFEPGTFLVRIVGDNSLPAKFFLRVA